MAENDAHPARPQDPVPDPVGRDANAAGVRDHKARVRKITQRRWESRAVAALAVVMLGVGVLATTLTRDNNNSGEAGAATTGKSLLGMSAPASLWAQRLAEVQAKGGHIQSRRIFVSSFSGSLSLATAACNANQVPIISFKTGSYSWAQVGAGNANTALASLHTRLVNLPCAVYAAIWHEPSGDGTATDFTKMQTRALPILGGTLIDPEVKVGVIGNGWWFNSNSQGLSDAELNQWVGSGVRAVSDFVAADTYQPKIGTEGVDGKVANMGSWARRVGGVRALGLGEWNVQSAQAVTDACNAIAAEPLMAFAGLWNNDGTGGANAHILTGARLTAFQIALANW